MNNISQQQSGRFGVQLRLVLIAGLLTVPQATAQSNVVRTRKTPSGPVRPVPLSHLYWHFLVYQNHLDTKASQLAAQGRDPGQMRTYFQNRLGLSDVEYDAIRRSSARLASKIRDLDTQAAAIKLGGPTQDAHAQLIALTAQRESAIDAEVAGLRSALAPKTVVSFESFLTQFFSPSNAVPRPSLQGAAAAKGVQQ